MRCLCPQPLSRLPRPFGIVVAAPSSTGSRGLRACSASWCPASSVLRRRGTRVWRHDRGPSPLRLDRSRTRGRARSRGACPTGRARRRDAGAAARQAQRHAGHGRARACHQGGAGAIRRAAARSTTVSTSRSPPAPTASMSGQDDMAVEDARRLLGPQAIIGLSIKTRGAGRGGAPRAARLRRHRRRVCDLLEGQSQSADRPCRLGAHRRRVPPARAGLSAMRHRRHRRRQCRRGHRGRRRRCRGDLGAVARRRSAGGRARTLRTRGGRRARATASAA